VVPLLIQNTDEKADTQYLVTFPEAATRSMPSWTMRQVGVYHQYVKRSGGEGQSLWILVHAKPDSPIIKNIELSVRGHDSILKLHTIVLSTHLKSWRWYLDSLNFDFEKIVSYHRRIMHFSIVADILKPG